MRNGGNNLTIRSHVMGSAQVTFKAPSRVTNVKTVAALNQVLICGFIRKT